MGKCTINKWVFAKTNPNIDSNHKIIFIYKRQFSLFLGHPRSLPLSPTRVTDDEVLRFIKPNALSSGPRSIFLCWAFYTHIPNDVTTSPTLRHIALA